MGRWMMVGLWVLGASAWAQAPGRFVKQGDELVAQVRERFYDAKKAAEWAARHKGYGAKAKTEEDFERLTHEALVELQASHTAYYPRESLGHVGLSSIFRWVLKLKEIEYVSMGVDVTERPEGLFVRHVFAGGPAQKAGLLRGDRLVSVEGKPFHPVRSLKDRAGKPTQVMVERARGGRPLTLMVTPRRVDPKAEWLEAQEKSSRVVERGGKRVAYQYLYSCAGPEHQEALEEYILYGAENADALVVDLRDGWGGCNVQFLNLFNTRLPVLTSVGRDGKQVVTTGAWLKPVVLLVNGGSRSGKEGFAYGVKKHHLARLVGERTAGGVLFGTPICLSDGALLWLAVSDARVDGEKLEGVGVEPDVAVPFDPRYAAGADPQLDRALDLLSGG
jgi:carboxyl-terminal processing protease